MGNANLAHVREALRTLSLHEADFAVTDSGLGRVTVFNRAVRDLDPHDEPWLTEWLTAEHLKAAILYGAAHMNWRKEHADGTDTTFNATTRATLIHRFNDWASQARARLEQYEHSSRTASDVAPWRIALTTFRDDPVSDH